MRDNHKPAAPDPERDARREAFMDSFLGRPQPSSTAPPSAPVGVDDGMVERATMALLGKSHDTAPGIDWRCDRAWTVNKVRKHMHAALTAALAQQPAAVDELPDCPHSALDGCDCYATQHQEPTT